MLAAAQLAFVPVVSAAGFPLRSLSSLCPLHCPSSLRTCHEQQHKLALTPTEPELAPKGITAGNSEASHRTARRNSPHRQRPSSRE